jgi:hypothetical protein
MKRMILSIAWLAICAANLSLFPAAAQGQRKPGARKKPREVNIYLRLAGKYDEAKNPGGLFPVKRFVGAGESLDAAFEALIAGATRRERKSGLAALHSGLEYNCITLSEDGTAIVRFTTSYKPYDPEHTISPSFVPAVERTARQFPMVKTVVVCLDDDQISATGESVDFCPGNRLN